MPSYSLITVGTKTSGNLGALARICSNFDLDRLIAVNPQCEIDEEAYVRSTQGRPYLDNIVVLETIEQAREYADIIIGLSARKGKTKTNFSRPATSIIEIAKDMQGYEGRVALVVGREDHGLTNEEVRACDMLVHIPMYSTNPVLNISHAAVIALWELTRNNEYSSLDEIPFRLIKRKEKEYFLEYLEKILAHSWLHEEKHETTLMVWRSILSRSLVTTRESPALVGTMRLIHKSMTKGHPPWDDCGKQVRD